MRNSKINTSRKCLGSLALSFLLGMLSAYAVNVEAACPGFTSFSPIKELAFAHSSGAGVTSYIKLDATAGVSADPCDCRVSGASTEYYITRSESTYTEGHKTLIGLATAAKAMGKKVYVFVTGCTAVHSGYALFSQIHTEP